MTKDKYRDCDALAERDRAGWMEEMEEPPTIVGVPIVEPMTAVIGAWSSQEGYERMTMVDAAGRVLASSLGSSVVIPLSAEGIKNWIYSTWSRVPIEPDVVGSYLDPPTLEDDEAEA